MQDTVLILDDDVNARIVKQTLLQVRGMQAIAPTTATEACDIVCREGAAVMIVAVADDAGLQSALRLRGQCEAFTSPTPRFVVIADQHGPALEGLDVDALLYRPVVPGEFVATIEGLVAASRPKAVPTPNGF